MLVGGAILSSIRIKTPTAPFRRAVSIEEVPGHRRGSLTNACGRLPKDSDMRLIHLPPPGIIRNLRRPRTPVRSASRISLPVDLRDKEKLDQIREKLKNHHHQPWGVAAPIERGRNRPFAPDKSWMCWRNPGRDPHANDRPPPIFKKGILKLDYLQPGMELKGTVLTSVPFRAFCGHWG